MLKSFLKIPTASHFTMQNIPFGVGKRQGSLKNTCATRIGDHVIDLKVLEANGMFSDCYKGKLFNKETLNSFMEKDRKVWKKARERVQELFKEKNSLDEVLEKSVIRVEDFVNDLPAKIGNYADFYSCYHHAFNCGVMFRGVINALSPNWLHLPIAYNGRSSTVQVNHDVRRPHGQIFDKATNQPIFSASRKLDYEVEIGFFLGGSPNPIGQPISASEALNNVFGVVLLNDWSARDIQLWEMQPLGPFGSKNFLTTISPWIVTLEALEPFKVPFSPQSPLPLPYLQGDFCSYDIDLFTSLKTLKSGDFEEISKTNMKYIYWSVSQQIAQLTVTGANIQPGDLLGSGTISGPDFGMAGCMMEMTKDAAEPYKLENGETRGYLEDFDVVKMEGFQEKNGFNLGLGELMSKVVT